MARQRMLHPGFFSDGKVCSLQPLGRLLFQGLWCEADKEGRLRDRPVDLKIRYLPVDNCDVNALLGELVAAGLIERYEVGGERIIAVRNFSRYQHPHHNEKASTLPARSVNVGAAPEITEAAQGLPEANRAESVTVIKTVTESITTPPARTAEKPAVNANDTLRDAVERLWALKRGKEPTRGWCTDAQLRDAFDRAGQDPRELLRVFSSALDREGFPRLVKFTDLLRYWDDYAATKGPEPGPGRDKRKSPVRAEDISPEAFREVGRAEF